MYSEEWVAENIIKPPFSRKRKTPRPQHLPSGPPRDVRLRTDPSLETRIEVIVPDLSPEMEETPTSCILPELSLVIPDPALELDYVYTEEAIPGASVSTSLAREPPVAESTESQ